MFRVKTLFLFAVLLAMGCTSVPESPIKAVCLVQGVGQLSSQDLQAHSEVAVTESFDEFKEIAETKVALWIDINAVDLVDIEWLSQSPQAFYPVVLVGNGDEACSFVNTIHYFSFAFGSTN